MRDSKRIYNIYRHIVTYYCDTEVSHECHLVDDGVLAGSADEAVAAYCEQYRLPVKKVKTTEDVNNESELVGFYTKHLYFEATEGILDTQGNHVEKDTNINDKHYAVTEECMTDDFYHDINEFFDEATEWFDGWIIPCIDSINKHNAQIISPVINDMQNLLESAPDTHIDFRVAVEKGGGIHVKWYTDYTVTEALCVLKYIISSLEIRLYDILWGPGKFVDEFLTGHTLKVDDPAGQMANLAKRYNPEANSRRVIESTIDTLTKLLEGEGNLDLDVWITKKVEDRIETSFDIYVRISELIELLLNMSQDSVIYYIRWKVSGDGDEDPCFERD